MSPAIMGTALACRAATVFILAAIDLIQRKARRSGLAK
jgi:hypothetical protein